MSPETKSFKIGTRKSRLAQWQANYSKWLLEEAVPDTKFEIVEIKTEADIQKDKPIYEMGGKGIFVKELESALIEKKIDLAVHSVKDMPADLPEPLCLAAVLERGDPRDVLISRGNTSLSSFTSDMKIGTSSLRRKAQILSFNPELRFIDVRGNIETRIKKVDSGAMAGVIISAAAILRLSLENRISEYFDTRVLLPAPGQGAIGIECRNEDIALKTILEKVNHEPSSTCVKGERAFLRHMGANCRVPVASLAAQRDFGEPIVEIQAMIASLDGRRILLERGVIPPENVEELGEKLAVRLLNQGGKEILDSLFDTDSEKNLPGKNLP